MSTALLQLNIRRPVVRDVATLLAIVGYGVAWRLFQITQPFVDAWCWRESDVAMIAENFYRNGYNIFYPQINWAAASSGYIGTEFPLVQDFRFGPGTATVYIGAGPNATSFRAEPCTSAPPVGARARPSAHRR